MSFDKPTRNALARMVSAARERLKEDITAQLQTDFRLQPDGSSLSLKGLTEDQQAAALELRQLLDHLAVSEPGPEKTRRALAHDRLVREIGFTVLNRLAALRLCEERELVVECVRHGMASEGFQLFDRLTGGALGSRYATYRAFLENLFDEIALDLGVLFDRHSPLSHVFPTERALEDVLDLLNDPALAHLWREDETIGWIYQYYNDGAERRQMRDESQAPRNSRELAVRNQFFTPRYVVEFLTDNTLGRIWYEMREGQTTLADACRYLVRRKHPIFLSPDQPSPEPYSPSQDDWGDPDLPGEMWTRPNPELEDLNDIWRYALTVSGYDYARAYLGADCADLANQRLRHYHETGTWDGSFEELRCCLFFEQRRYHHFGQGPEGKDATAIQELYKAACRKWDLEVDTIPCRPKKDPRDIRILDPASGSCHFLLYAFELLTTIYEEAWPDADSPPFSETGRTLHDDYADLDTLRRETPILILRHNLHGIDIDPRAVQIGGLALWLRAQRSFQQLGLRAGERPRITRVNVVCAEPMPGERDLLDEFVANLQTPELGELVRFVFDRMQLAGEAGSLLKIEEELRGKIEEMRTQPGLLFAKEGDFWGNTEARVLEALKDYAERAANGRTARRQLFADDAAQGLAFIDLCLKRYDVALMNPPYGKGSSHTETLVQERFPRAKNDLYAAFVERGLQQLRNGGLLGALTGRNGFVHSALANWRAMLLEDHGLSCVADLGAGVLDAAFVETAAYVIEARSRVRWHPIVFTDVRNEDDKQLALLETVDNFHSAREDSRVFVRSSIFFTELPKAPLIYRATDRIRSLFTEGDRFEDKVGQARLGLRTLDDFRYIKLAWEVPVATIGWKLRWVLLNKGGSFARFYFDFHLLLDWANNGAALKAAAAAKYGSVTRIIQAQGFYGLPGLTYPRRSLKGFAVRAFPSHGIFTDKGCSIFLQTAQVPFLWLGILNSTLIAACVELQSGSAAYEVGYVQRLPALDLDSSASKEICATTRKALVAARNLASTLTTSRNAICPWRANIHQDLHSLVQEGLLLSDEAEEQEIEALKTIDQLLAEALSFDEQDKIILSEILEQRDRPMLLRSDEEDLENEQQEDKAFAPATSHGAIEYVLGLVYGRWDTRIALDPTLAPKLQDPFDPLPVCPPGMLVGPDGLPATPGHIVSQEWLRARPNAITLPPEGSVHRATIRDDEYPLRIDWDGILVDDPGLDAQVGHPHPADIVRRVREALTVLWGERAESIEQEACEILGVASLRDYFRKPSGFFADHLKRYSKSRRQSPIYWPLSTPSGRYTVWVYYHRLNADTLFTIVNQYVTPKIDAVQDRVNKLNLKLAESSGKAAAELRDQLGDMVSFLSELKDFRAELLRVAALPYKPDLNDGVIINAAPLAKLFRLRKWANDAAAVWKKLEAGEYDWAHLAYTIWPERVKKVCEKDRSIAIAHGLEHLCRVEVKKAKGKRKKKDEEAETIEMEWK